MSDRTIPRKRTRQRRLGSYYTPEPIVRLMLRSCLSGPLTGHTSNPGAPLRILDPACGDGAFLWPALQEVRARPCQFAHPQACPDASANSCSTVDLVAAHLFGVDIDRHAISNLRHRFAECLEETDAENRRHKEIMFANFRVGDALAGPNFASGSERRAERANHRIFPNGINWAQSFPEVAAAGGFDLVIGNPPYCSEKGAGSLFRQIARTELGRRWRQPRMDLWHYFLHRGLDLLRPGGVLCYIVNTYWMAARSAQPLIERLRTETTIGEIVLLGDAPLFEGVSGRHMILQVQKLRSDRPCRVTDFSHLTDAPTLLEALTQSAESSDPRAGARERSLAQASLFSRGRFIPYKRPQRWRSQRTQLLGDLFDVRQGIAENPPFVTPAIRQALGNELKVGEGIFVLTPEEVAKLGLSSTERELLRPYYATRSIDRYELPHNPTNWILYLTRRTVPELAAFSHISDHLSRFRPILERRREVRRGCIDWWHLHWPREERLFLEPRILAVQMGRWPRFVYVERPTFVGFAVNIVRSREISTLTLPAATAVLNSERAAAWFAQHAKRRGVALDISGTVLREFPFPEFEQETAARLAALCQRRQQVARHVGATPADRRHALSPDRQGIEREIECLLSR